MQRECSLLARDTFLCVVLCYAAHATPHGQHRTFTHCRLLGSLIAGWGDLGFDPTSYAYVIGNNVCTALYLISIKKVTAATKLSAFGIMVCNSTLSIPLLLGRWSRVRFVHSHSIPLSLKHARVSLNVVHAIDTPHNTVAQLITGEWQQVLEFPYLYDSGFQKSFLFSALLAFGINVSIFRCTQVNDALTTSVTGQLKNLVTTVIGIFAFNVTATAPLTLGIAIGLVGSLVYSWYMYTQAQLKSKAEKEGGSKDVDADADADGDGYGSAVPLLDVASKVSDGGKPSSPKSATV
jgi:solute carrier family 35 protein